MEASMLRKRPRAMTSAARTSGCGLPRDALLEWRNPEPTVSMRRNNFADSNRARHPPIRLAATRQVTFPLKGGRAIGVTMKYVRMPIEVESPEEQGYDTIRFNLSESSIRDRVFS